MKLRSIFMRPIGILALGLVLVGGSFALAPHAYAIVAADVSYQAEVKPVGFFEKMKLMFTFNAEKKAELLSDFSNRNFELAKEKINEGKAGEADTYFKKSDEDTLKATASISKIEDEEKQKEALSLISATASNRTAVLTAVQVKVENPVAKEAIGRALENQAEVKSSVDAKIQSLLSKIAELEAKIKELENKNSISIGEKQEVKPSTPSVSDNRKYDEQKIEEKNNNSTDWYEDNAWRSPPGGWDKKPDEETLVACDPSIKILSPNGGEVYHPGEQITIKWESSCAPFGFDIGLHFADGLDLHDPQGGFTFLAWATPNDGEEVVTLPDETEFRDERVFGRHYKVEIAKHAFGIPLLPADASDNLFTIEQ